MMESANAFEWTQLAIGLVQSLAWPLVAVFVFVRFTQPIRLFIENLSEFSFKAAGVEASGRRDQVKAAALLGAAEAARADSAEVTAEERALGIVGLLEEASAPLVARRLAGASVLWVDDRPANNDYERSALEALGIRFTPDSST